MIRYNEPEKRKAFRGSKAREGREVNKMIICPSCSTQAEDGTKYCATCGTRLPDKAVEETVKAVEETVNTVEETAKNVEETVNTAEESASFTLLEEKAAPKKGIKLGLHPKKLMLYGGVALLLILALVLLPKIFAGGGSGGLSDYVMVINGDGEWIGISKSGQLVKKESDARMYGGDVSGDGSKMFIISSEDELWIFDGKKYTQVASDVDTALFSFDGSTLAYLSSDEELYLYKNGKSQKVAGDIYSMDAISPDGKAVAYRKRGDDSTRRSYYYDGKEHELGKNVTVKALSQGGRYVYFSNSEGKLYVQPGSNSDKRVRLLENSSFFYLNKSGTQFIGYDGTKMYFSENGKEREDLGKNSLKPLVSISGNVNAPFLPWDSLKNQLYTHYSSGSYAIYRLSSKLETNSLISKAEDIVLFNDGKHVSYLKNNKLYLLDASQNNPNPKELAVEVRDYIPAYNGKLFLYENEDGATFTVNTSGKSSKVLDETVDDWTPVGDGAFLYILDDTLYYTKGGKGSKVSGIGADVNRMQSMVLYCLVGDDDDTVYFTKDGKKLSVIYKD